MSILLINACVREESRTMVLARRVLEEMEGEVTELALASLGLAPLDRVSLARRDSLLREGRLDDPMLRYARQFAEAEEIVIAAPFWDLSFPALLKVYLEQIAVAGITFRYVEGRPVGLCRAKRLTYVTTSGGPITEDFGYTYVKALARSFYGIGSTRAVRAMKLDMLGIPSAELLARAEISVIE